MNENEIKICPFIHSKCIKEKCLAHYKDQIQVRYKVETINCCRLIPGKID